MSKNKDKSNLKSTVQEEFWKSIINKYEDRNANLESELLRLRQRVDQMDASVPAVMTYNMAKLAQEKPSANVNNFIKPTCTCSTAKEELAAPLKLPDMTNLSVFSIEPADICYMEKIKQLTEKEKILIEDVNKLKAKERALKDVKKKIDEISSHSKDDSSGGIAVKGPDLGGMNDRLMQENQRLFDEIADLKLELKHARETVEGPMQREMERERRKNATLEADLRRKDRECEDKHGETIRETSLLKKQLEANERNLKDMREINCKLKDETSFLSKRMEQLQSDLINQKLSEATTLAALRAELDKKRRSRSSICSCKHSGTGGNGPGGPGSPDVPGGNGGPGSPDVPGGNDGPDGPREVVASADHTGSVVGPVHSKGYSGSESPPAEGIAALENGQGEAVIEGGSMENETKATLTDETDAASIAVSTEKSPRVSVSVNAIAKSTTPSAASSAAVLSSLHPPDSEFKTVSEGISCSCLISNKSSDIQEPPVKGPRQECTCPPSGGDLYMIARDLSKELEEAKQDNTVPETLLQTVSDIKELCDLIDQKCKVCPPCPAQISQTSSCAKICTPPCGKMSPCPAMFPKSIDAVCPAMTPKPSACAKGEIPCPALTSKATSGSKTGMPCPAMRPKVSTDAKSSIPGQSAMAAKTSSGTRSSSTSSSTSKSKTSSTGKSKFENAGTPITEHGEDHSENSECICEWAGQCEIESSKSSDSTGSNVCRCNEEGEEPQECPTSSREAVTMQDQEVTVTPAMEQTTSIGVDDVAYNSVSLLESRCSCIVLNMESSSQNKLEIFHNNDKPKSEAIAATGSVKKTDNGLLQKCTDGVNVTTTMVTGGFLEVVTEGSDGIIETSMVVTDTGNIEVITEISEKDNEGNNAVNVQNYNAGGKDDGGPDPKSKSSDSDPSHVCSQYECIADCQKRSVTFSLQEDIAGGDQEGVHEQGSKLKVNKFESYGLSELGFNFGISPIADKLICPNIPFDPIYENSITVNYVVTETDRELSEEADSGTSRNPPSSSSIAFAETCESCQTESQQSSIVSDSLGISPNGPSTGVQSEATKLQNNVISSCSPDETLNVNIGSVTGTRSADLNTNLVMELIDPCTECNSVENTDKQYVHYRYDTPLDVIPEDDERIPSTPTSGGQTDNSSNSNLSMANCMGGLYTCDMLSSTFKCSCKVQAPDDIICGEEDHVINTVLTTCAHGYTQFEICPICVSTSLQVSKFLALSKLPHSGNKDDHKGVLTGVLPQFPNKPALKRCPLHRHLPDTALVNTTNISQDITNTDTVLIPFSNTQESSKMPDSIDILKTQLGNIMSKFGADHQIYGVHESGLESPTPTVEEEADILRNLINQSTEMLERSELSETQLDEIINAIVASSDPRVTLQMITQMEGPILSPENGKDSTCDGSSLCKSSSCPYHGKTSETDKVLEEVSCSFDRNIVAKLLQSEATPKGGKVSNGKSKPKVSIYDENYLSNFYKTEKMYPLPYVTDHCVYTVPQIYSNRLPSCQFNCNNSQDAGQITDNYLEQIGTQTISGGMDSTRQSGEVRFSVTDSPIGTSTSASSEECQICQTVPCPFSNSNASSCVDQTCDEAIYYYCVNNFSWTGAEENTAPNTPTPSTASGTPSNSRSICVCPAVPNALAQGESVQVSNVSNPSNRCKYSQETGYNSTIVAAVDYGRNVQSDTPVSISANTSTNNQCLRPKEESGKGPQAVDNADVQILSWGGKPGPVTANLDSSNFKATAASKAVPIERKRISSFVGEIGSDLTSNQNEVGVKYTTDAIAEKTRDFPRGSKVVAIPGSIIQERMNISQMSSPNESEEQEQREHDENKSRPGVNLNSKDSDASKMCTSTCTSPCSKISSKGSDKPNVKTCSGDGNTKYTCASSCIKNLSAALESNANSNRTNKDIPSAQSPQNITSSKNSDQQSSKLSEDNCAPVCQWPCSKSRSNQSNVKAKENGNVSTKNKPSVRISETISDVEATCGLTCEAVCSKSESNENKRKPMQSSKPTSTAPSQNTSLTCNSNKSILKPSAENETGKSVSAYTCEEAFSKSEPNGYGAKVSEKPKAYEGLCTPNTTPSKYSDKPNAVSSGGFASGESYCAQTCAALCSKSTFNSNNTKTEESKKSCSPTCTGTCSQNTILTGYSNKSKLKSNEADVGKVSCALTCKAACSKSVSNTHSIINPMENTKACGKTCTGSCSQNTSQYSEKSNVKAAVALAAGESNCDRSRSAVSPKCTPTCTSPCHHKQNELVNTDGKPTTKPSDGAGVISPKSKTCSSICTGPCSQAESEFIKSDKLTANSPPIRELNAFGECESNRTGSGENSICTCSSLDNGQVCTPTCKGVCSQSNSKSDKVSCVCNSESVANSTPSGTSSMCSRTCTGPCSKIQTLPKKFETTKMCTRTCIGICAKESAPSTPAVSKNLPGGGESSPCTCSSVESSICTSTCKGICSQSHSTSDKDYCCVCISESAAKSPPSGTSTTCSSTCTGTCSKTQTSPQVSATVPSSKIASVVDGEKVCASTCTYPCSKIEKHSGSMQTPPIYVNQEMGTSCVASCQAVCSKSAIKPLSQKESVRSCATSCTGPCSQSQAQGGYAQVPSVYSQKEALESCTEPCIIDNIVEACVVPCRIISTQAVETCDQKDIPLSLNVYVAACPSLCSKAENKKTGTAEIPSIYSNKTATGSTCFPTCTAICSELEPPKAKEVQVDDTTAAANICVDTCEGVCSKKGQVPSQLSNLAANFKEELCAATCKGVCAKRGGELGPCTCNDTPTINTDNSGEYSLKPCVCYKLNSNVASNQSVNASKLCVATCTADCSKISQVPSTISNKEKSGNGPFEVDRNSKPCSCKNATNSENIKECVCCANYSNDKNVKVQIQTSKTCATTCTSICSKLNAKLESVQSTNTDNTCANACTSCSKITAKTETLASNTSRTGHEVGTGPCSKLNAKVDISQVTSNRCVDVCTDTCSKINATTEETNTIDKKDCFTTCEATCAQKQNETEDICTCYNAQTEEETLAPNTDVVSKIESNAKSASQYSDPEKVVPNAIGEPTDTNKPAQRSNLDKVGSSSNKGKQVEIDEDILMDEYDIPENMFIYSEVTTEAQMAQVVREGNSIIETEMKDSMYSYEGVKKMKVDGGVREEFHKGLMTEEAIVVTKIETGQVTDVEPITQQAGSQSKIPVYSANGRGKASGTDSTEKNTKINPCSCSKIPVAITNDCKSDSKKSTKDPNMEASDPRKNIPGQFEPKSKNVCECPDLLALLEQVKREWQESQNLLRDEISWNTSKKNAVLDNRKNEGKEKSSQGKDYTQLSDDRYGNKTCRGGPCTKKRKCKYEIVPEGKAKRDIKPMPSVPEEECPLSKAIQAASPPQMHIKQCQCKSDYRCLCKKQSDRAGHAPWGNFNDKETLLKDETCVLVDDTDIKGDGDSILSDNLMKDDEIKDSTIHPQDCTCIDCITKAVEETSVSPSKDISKMKCTCRQAGICDKCKSIKDELRCQKHRKFIDTCRSKSPNPCKSPICPGNMANKTKHMNDVEEQIVKTQDLGDLSGKPTPYHSKAPSTQDICITCYSDEPKMIAVKESLNNLLNKIGGGNLPMRTIVTSASNIAFLHGDHEMVNGIADSLRQMLNDADVGLEELVTPDNVHFFEFTTSTASTLEISSRINKLLATVGEDKMPFPTLRTVHGPLVLVSTSFNSLSVINTFLMNHLKNVQYCLQECDICLGTTTLSNLESSLKETGIETPKKPVFEEKVHVGNVTPSGHIIHPSSYDASTRSHDKSGARSIKEAKTPSERHEMSAEASTHSHDKSGARSIQEAKTPSERHEMSAEASTHSHDKSGARSIQEAKTPSERHEMSAEASTHSHDKSGARSIQEAKTASERHEMSAEASTHSHDKSGARSIQEAKAASERHEITGEAVADSGPKMSEHKGGLADKDDSRVHSRADEVISHADEGKSTSDAGKRADLDDKGASPDDEDDSGAYEGATRADKGAGRTDEVMRHADEGESTTHPGKRAGLDDKGASRGEEDVSRANDGGVSGTGKDDVSRARDGGVTRDACTICCSNASLAGKGASPYEKGAISRADEGGVSRAGEGAVSRGSEAGVSRASEGGVSRASEGGVSRASEGGVSRASEGGARRVDEGGVSRVGEGNVSLEREGGASRAGEGAVSRGSGGGVSGAGESNVSHAAESKVSRADEGGTRGPDEGNVSRADEGGASRASQGGASRASQGGASRASQGGVSRESQGGVSRASQGDVSRADEGGASRASQSGVSRADEGGASRASEGRTSRASEGGASRASKGGASRVSEGGVSRVEEGGISREGESNVSRADEGGASRASESGISDAEEVGVRFAHEGDDSNADESSSRAAEDLSRTYEDVSGAGEGGIDHANEDASRDENGTGRADDDVSPTGDSVSTADEGVSRADDGVTTIEEDVTLADESTTRADEVVSQADEGVTRAEKKDSRADEEASEAVCPKIVCKCDACIGTENVNEALKKIDLKLVPFKTIPYFYGELVFVPEDGVSRASQGAVSRADEGGASRASEGGTNRASEGGASRASEGGTNRASEGGASRASEGGASRASEGGTNRASEGGASRASEGGTNRASEGGASRASEGGASRTSEGGGINVIDPLKELLLAAKDEDLPMQSIKTSNGQRVFIPTSKTPSKTAIAGYFNDITKNVEIKDLPFDSVETTDGNQVIFLPFNPDMSDKINDYLKDMLEKSGFDTANIFKSEGSKDKNSERYMDSCAFSCADSCEESCADSGALVRNKEESTSISSELLQPLKEADRKSSDETDSRTASGHVKDNADEIYRSSSIDRDLLELLEKVGDGKVPFRTKRTPSGRIVLVPWSSSPSAEQVSKYIQDLLDKIGERKLPFQTLENLIITPPMAEETEVSEALERNESEKEALEDEVIEKETSEKEALETEGIEKKSVEEEALRSEPSGKETLETEPLASEASPSEALASEALGSEALASEVLGSEASASKDLAISGVADGERIDESVNKDKAGRKSGQGAVECVKSTDLSPVCLICKKCLEDKEGVKSPKTSKYESSEGPTRKMPEANRDENIANILPRDEIDTDREFVICEKYKDKQRLSSERTENGRTTRPTSKRSSKTTRKTRGEPVNKEGYVCSCEGKCVCLKCEFPRPEERSEKLVCSCIGKCKCIKCDFLDKMKSVDEDDESFASALSELSTGPPIKKKGPDDPKRDPGAGGQGADSCPGSGGHGNIRSCECKENRDGGQRKQERGGRDGRYGNQRREHDDDDDNQVTESNRSKNSRDHDGDDYTSKLGREHEINGYASKYSKGRSKHCSENEYCAKQSKQSKQQENDQNQSKHSKASRDHSSNNNKEHEGDNYTSRHSREQGIIDYSSKHSPNRSKHSREQEDSDRGSKYSKEYGQNRRKRSVSSREQKDSGHDGNIHAEYDQNKPNFREQDDDSQSKRDDGSKQSREHDGDDKRSKTSSQSQGRRAQAKDDQSKHSSREKEHDSQSKRDDRRKHSREHDGADKRSKSSREEQEAVSYDEKCLCKRRRHDGDNQSQDRKGQDDQRKHSIIEQDDSQSKRDDRSKQSREHDGDDKRSRTSSQSQGRKAQAKDDVSKHSTREQDNDSQSKRDDRSKHSREHDGDDKRSKSSREQEAVSYDEKCRCTRRQHDGDNQSQDRKEQDDSQTKQDDRSKYSREHEGDDGRSKSSREQKEDLNQSPEEQEEDSQLKACLVCKGCVGDTEEIKSAKLDNPAKQNGKLQDDAAGVEQSQTLRKQEDVPRNEEVECNNVKCIKNVQGYKDLKAHEDAVLETKKFQSNQKPSEALQDIISPEFKDEVKELQKLMTRIKCSCAKAETAVGSVLQKKGSLFENTLSALQLALETFEQKCQTKDLMIDTLKKQLETSEPFDFRKKFQSSNMNKQIHDYNRAFLNDSLPKPDDLEFYTSPQSCACEYKGNVQSCDCQSDTTPLAVTDIRRIGVNSILMKWSGPVSPDIVGFEIYINGVLRSRIYSPRRRTAIIDTIDLSSNLEVKLFATGFSGTGSPAAIAYYNTD